MTHKFQVRSSDAASAIPSLALKICLQNNQTDLFTKYFVREHNKLERYKMAKCPS